MTGKDISPADLCSLVAAQAASLARSGRYEAAGMTLRAAMYLREADYVNAHQMLTDARSLAITRTEAGGYVELISALVRRCRPHA